MNEKQKEFERSALIVVSEILVKIRSTARTDCGDARMKLIEELADSVHNLPRIIAEGNAEALSDLAQFEFNTARALLTNKTNQLNK